MAEQGVIQPEPVKRLPQPQFEYCINSTPPWRLAVASAFQHFLMSLLPMVLIPHILVPAMGGSNVETAVVTRNLVFCCGISTLLHTWFGSRLPNVVVPSYNYIWAVLYIAKRHQAIPDPSLRFISSMRAVQGALMVSSAVQYLIGFLGLWRHVVKLLSPLSAGLLLMFVGSNFKSAGEDLATKCFYYGFPSIAFMVAISKYLPGFTPRARILVRFPLLLAVFPIWILAVFGQASRCRTDHFGMITGSQWIHFPLPFQFGMPSLNAVDATAMVVASILGLVESSGCFITCARYGGATAVPPSVHGRGALWLGVGSFINGCFGTIAGSTISVSNSGLLGLSKVGSRRVIQLSASFMILCSVSGKFGSVILSIPDSILGVAQLVLCAYVVSAGYNHLTLCNMNNSKVMFILGFSSVMGQILPHYYGPSTDDWKSFNLWDAIAYPLLASHCFVGAAIAILLDHTLRSEGGGDYKKDNGLALWEEEFQVYNSDRMGHEFYSLPLSLDNGC